MNHLNHQDLFITAKLAKCAKFNPRKSADRFLGVLCVLRGAKSAFDTTCRFRQPARPRACNFHIFPLKNFRITGQVSSQEVSTPCRSNQGNSIERQPHKSLPLCALCGKKFSVASNHKRTVTACHFPAPAGGNPYSRRRPTGGHIMSQAKQENKITKRTHFQVALQRECPLALPPTQISSNTENKRQAFCTP